MVKREELTDRQRAQLDILDIVQHRLLMESDMQRCRHKINMGAGVDCAREIVSEITGKMVRGEYEKSGLSPQCGA